MGEIKDIDMHYLDALDEKNEHIRLIDLTRTAMRAVARQLRVARSHAEAVEMNAWQRVRKLYMLGMSVNELVELTGLTKREINKWVKGLNNEQTS